MSDQGNHRVNFDLSINVPTLLTVLFAVIGGIASGVSTYNGVDRRVTGNTSDIATLRRDVDRIDRSASASQQEQSAKVDALRAEMRGDLRDINDKLDQLLINRPRSDMKGWQR